MGLIYHCQRKWCQSLGSVEVESRSVKRTRACPGMLRQTPLTAFLRVGICIRSGAISEPGLQMPLFRAFGEGILGAGSGPEFIFQYRNFEMSVAHAT